MRSGCGHRRVGLVVALSLSLCLLSCGQSRRATRWPTPPPGEPSTLALMNGGSLHYQTAGDGEALVLIHGGFGDRRMWDEVFLPLAEDYAVVRYDHRGFGKSSRPDAVYSPVSDLLRLMKALGIERAHLIGNSLGGELALDFALLHPERVASLVIVSSGPSGLPVPDEDLAPVLEVFTVARERSLDEAARLWLAHPMVKVTAADPRQAPKLARMVEQNAAIFRMPFERWPQEPLDPPTSERLHGIQAATLLVIGSLDTEVVRSMAQVAADTLPHARLVEIEGADHLPQMCKAREFLSVVRNFLRDVALESAAPPAKR